VRACLKLNTESQQEFCFISTYLLWKYEGKFEVVQVKMAANLSLLLKMAAGQHTGSKLLTSLSGMLWFSTGTTSTVLQLCLKTWRFAAEAAYIFPVTGNTL